MYYYSIPLHIIRNVYLTIQSLRQCVDSLIRYRKATSNMNERFPEAPPADLVDQICIVCREDLTQGRKLPCGHILHFHCLLTWLQRQQTCPICREPVLAEAQPQAQPQPQPGLPGQAAGFQWPPEVQQQWDRNMRRAFGNNAVGGNRPEPNRGVEAEGGAFNDYEVPAHHLRMDPLLEQLSTSVPEILQNVQVIQIQVQSLQEEIVALREQLDKPRASTSSPSTPEQDEVEGFVERHLAKYAESLPREQYNEKKTLLVRRLRGALHSFHHE